MAGVFHRHRVHPFQQFRPGANLCPILLILNMKPQLRRKLVVETHHLWLRQRRGLHPAVEAVWQVQVAVFNFEGVVGHGLAWFLNRSLKRGQTPGTFGAMKCIGGLTPSECRVEVANATTAGGFYRSGWHFAGPPYIWHDEMYCGFDPLGLGWPLSRIWVVIGSGSDPNRQIFSAHVYLTRTRLAAFHVG